MVKASKLNAASESVNSKIYILSLIRFLNKLTENSKDGCPSYLLEEGSNIFVSSDDVVGV